jgi:hypothetical protein
VRHNRSIADAASGERLSRACTTTDQCVVAKIPARWSVGSLGSRGGHMVESCYQTGSSAMTAIVCLAVFGLGQPLFFEK